MADSSGAAGGNSSGGSLITTFTGMGGALLQARAMEEAQKAAALASIQEMARQQGFAQRAGQQVGGLVQKSGRENFDKVRQESTANRTQALGKASGINLFGQGAPQMNSADMLRSNVTTKNRVALGSYGDWALRNLIDKIQVQNELNKIYGEAGGSANITAPAERNQALHSQDSAMIAGAMLQSGAPALGAAYDSMRSGTKAPTYVSGNNTNAPWTSGQSADYLRFSNVS